MTGPHKFLLLSCYIRNQHLALWYCQ